MKKCTFEFQNLAIRTEFRPLVSAIFPEFYRIYYKQQKVSRSKAKKHDFRDCNRHIYYIIAIVYCLSDFLIKFSETGKILMGSTANAASN